MFVFIVLLCCVHCSFVDNTGVRVRDDEQDAVLLGREVDSFQNLAVVTFSRPLVTSDVNDEDFDRVLFLYFGFGPFHANSSNPIGDPGLNRWISNDPIQFDCNINCKSTLQPCSAAACILHV